MTTHRLELLSALAVLALGCGGPRSDLPADGAPEPASDAATPDDAAAPDAGPSCGVERCDGRTDEDCDGTVDEGCDCTDGVERSCGSSAGACRAGRARCVDGAWGACEGGTPARPETCDGERDEDCDGVVDEGCECASDAARPCGSGVGACEPGRQSCVDGTWGACSGALGPETETCDGSLDEDCDGFVDEGCACTDGSTRACGSSTGACAAGTQRCDDGSWGSCAGGAGPASETCDGAVDEDCDGAVDEGCDCTDGRSRACGSDVGACVAGVQTCTAGSWDACTGALEASTERCDGSVDQDCDGLVDEGCECTDGSTRACGSDVGECAPGSQSCAGGSWGACGGATGPTTEACDGSLDEDCDGTVDEGCPTCTPHWVITEVDHDLTDSGREHWFDAGLDVTPTDAVHIVYIDARDDEMRWARRHAGSWISNAFGGPSVADDVDLAIDDMGRLHVGYYDQYHTRPAYFRFETFSDAPRSTVPDAVGYPGSRTHTNSRVAIDVGPGGDGAMVMYNTGSTDFTHALIDGSTASTGWAEVFDSVSPWPHSGAIADVAVDPTGGVHAAYWSEDRETELRYAYRASVGGPWTLSAVETSSDGSVLGTLPAIATDASGGVHVVYGSQGAGLRHAYRGASGGSWTVETVDSRATNGHGISVDGSGVVHVSYGLHYPSRDLMYASREPGGTWTSMTVDAGRVQNWAVPIAADSAGGVHIAYHEMDTDTLRHAELVTCP